MSKKPEPVRPDHAQRVDQNKPVGQRPQDGPKNQTQDVQHQVGEPVVGHNPDPATNEDAPLPHTPAAPIDPNHPELPREPIAADEVEDQPEDPRAVRDRERARREDHPRRK